MLAVKNGMSLRESPLRTSIERLLHPEVRYAVTNSEMLLALCALETNMIVPFSGQVQVIEPRQLFAIDEPALCAGCRPFGIDSPWYPTMWFFR